MEDVKKQLFNVINDNAALAQVFVVIFFFEDYLILVEKKSLLDTTLDFDKITLHPFILFFVFIALAKTFWFLWHMGLVLLKHKLDLLSGEGDIYKKVSVLAFMLGILLFTYYGLVESNPMLAPVNTNDHPFLSRLVMAFILVPILACMIISMMNVNYDKEKN